MRKLNEALDRTREYLLSNQRSDGTWLAPVESDPRATAFYLNTIWNLGREPDDETRQMELYLSSEQLACGGWQAWPGGEPDVDVTLACALALETADTDRGRQARRMAQGWLSSQPLPEIDSFWRGMFALNGDLDWADVPYLTPRLVSNPDWLHPNIYDFSFLRIAVVSALLLQANSAQHPRRMVTRTRPADSEQDPAFAEWKRRWIEEARKPIRGVLPLLSEVVRIVDRMWPVAKHTRAATDWLLMHQEADGSFFSSVHMTSVAVVTLHRLDASRYEKQIESGLAGMRNWQLMDERGRRQQFTDATNWHTFLCLHLLSGLGLPASHHQIQRARDYTISSQGAHLGDWSHRTRNPSAGGWGFQRVGKWYPDTDDTVMAVTALLDLREDASRDAVTRGVRWLLSMQSSNGGWASWDRNDRPWVRLPAAGPWFARDLASTEITARIIVLLLRIVRREYEGFDDDVTQAAQCALRRGLRWLNRNRKDGIWFGRWFTHYLYGTCHALEVYSQVGRERDDPRIQTTRSWLVSVANADGGFGEAPDSGRDGQFVNAASTPFHTGCALIGLIHAGAVHHPAARRAVDWLLHHQTTDGTWINEDFFAAGVPGLWYANFALTPTYYAAKSLLLYKQSSIGTLESTDRNADGESL